MRDGVGAVQSVLVLGGGSEIAQAIVDRLVASRCRTVVLAVRDPEKASRALDRLKANGVDEAEAVAFDALDPARHEAVIDGVFRRHGDIDMVIVAFGVLGSQPEFDLDPMAAVDAARANYVGAVSASLVVAKRFREQGHGTLLVLSSVAGMRARADNFVYGSTKAGLDAFAQGLGDALIGSGARVVVVRPGFVHTKMTEGMASAPFSTTPEAVADAVMSGLAKGREVIWAPAIVGPVFAVLRQLPRPLWRRVSAR
jgi:decaprenylphospho-beta-D-erythro-pentofuranosid-2-ulose 2-reductase